MKNVALNNLNQTTIGTIQHDSCITFLSVLFDVSVSTKYFCHLVRKKIHHSNSEMMPNAKILQNYIKTLWHIGKVPKITGHMTQGPVEPRQLEILKIGYKILLILYQFCLISLIFFQIVYLLCFVDNFIFMNQQYRLGNYLLSCTRSMHSNAINEIC